MWFLSRRSAGETAAGETVELRQHVALYRRLSPLRMRLNHRLVERLTGDAMNEAADRLGILQQGVMVFETEDESSVLMDYAIYEIRREGRNAVEDYLCESPPEPDSDEMTLLSAMQHASYTMVAVEQVKRGVGCQVVDLATGQRRWLVDLGLGSTGEPGLVLATRLLDFGDFVTTSGAAIAVGVCDDQQIEQLQRQIARAAVDPDFDPAEIIGKLLRRPGGDRTRYVEPGASEKNISGRRRSRLQLEPAASREQLRSRRRPTPSQLKKRCHCGSGKLHKNCCAGKPDAP